MSGKKSKSSIPRSLRRLFPNVKSVTDSTENVVVEVKDSDNKSGRRKAATGCAMAKAVCRQFHADGAIIGLSKSYIIKGDKAIRFETPSSVQREITSFDRNN